VRLTFGELAITSSYLFQKKDRALNKLVGEKQGAGRIAVVSLIMLLAAVSGCAELGPNSVRHGRPAYNDAILTTGDGQLLQNIVRLAAICRQCRLPRSVLNHLESLHIGRSKRRHRRWSLIELRREPYAVQGHFDDRTESDDLLYAGSR